MAREGNSGGFGGTRVLIILGVALVLGIVALLGVYTVVRSYQASIVAAQRPKDVVMAIVAARDLYQGIEITEEDLYAVEIPPQYLNDSIYQSPEHVVGRVPRERILANEFIREERLADATSGVGLNAIVPRGRRAISVNLTDAAAVSGFVNPTDYVDVLVTMDNKKSGRSTAETKQTSTLLQAVYVLAVNSRVTVGPVIPTKDGDEDEETLARQQAMKRLRPSVTFSVTPEEAEKVAFAAAQGRITLSLRNAIDIEDQELGEGVNADTVLGYAPVAAPQPGTGPRKPKAPQKPAAPPKCYIEQIKAGKATRVTVDCPS